MKFFLLWILIFFKVFTIIFCLQPCPQNSYFNCSCDFNESPGYKLQIECPMNEDNNIFIEINKKDEEILIECPFEINKFDYDYLPKHKIDRAFYLKIHLCPWTFRPFDRLFEKFHLQEVKVFEFSISYSKNVTVEADLFQQFETLQELKLNHISITTIDEKVFQHTPNLQFLELKDDNLTLTPDLFRYVPQLKSLDLSGNNVKHIPERFFESLQNLEYLYLYNNCLKKLTKNVFRGLSNLKILELTENRIEEISITTFNNLKKLQEINFSSNRLKTLSANVFTYNKKLEIVRIRYNFNLQVPDFLFANFSNLSYVDLTGCQLTKIPEHIFENSTNLKVIQLQNNFLKDLPENVFQGLENLQEIRLENNKVTNLSKVLRGLSKLKNLYLQKNLLEILSFENFIDLINLEKINLNENKIRQIDSRIFSNKNNLKIINLANNRISNPIEEIIQLNNSTSITELDLSHNFIKILKLRNIPATNLTLKLSDNKISSVDFRDINFTSNLTTIFLKNNPFNCNYEIYDLYNFFKNRERNHYKFNIPSKRVICADPIELKNTALTSLPINITFQIEEKFQNQTHCPRSCVCKWRPLDTSVVIDCSNQNLNEYPKIDLSKLTFIKFKQTELNLNKNYLIRGPEDDLQYKNVTKLYLGFNQIQDVTWLPPKLEVLDLHHNRLVNLKPEIVQQLINSKFLIKLVLDDNPWLCDCSFKTFANFLRLTSTKFVEKPNLFCSNKNSSLVTLTDGELCSNSFLIILLLIVVSFLLILSIFFAFYYRYQKEIKIWLFSKNLCLWWVTEEELDKEKLYDAFISYSHKDENFIIKYLVPILESGPNPHKLCLHFRNWIPGEFISTQITKSVLNSRRTLVVLSKNFLESVWGKMEFRTAHTQAMTEGRARVIIVLYGDIQVDELDEELKSYLKTNTYVKWGDPYFWHKLKYALPYKKISKEERNYKKNITTSENVNLIQSVQSSPGSTPPISLSSSFINLTPVDFWNKNVSKKTYYNIK